MQEKENSTFFAVKRKEDFAKLEQFLKSKRYNCFSSGHSDKNGKPLIGLTWDNDIDNDWSKSWTKVALVWFLNEKLEDEVRKLGIIKKHLSKE